jgi:hypothetical protein
VLHIKGNGNDGGFLSKRGTIMKKINMATLLGIVLLITASGAVLSGEAGAKNLEGESPERNLKEEILQADGHGERCPSFETMRMLMEVLACLARNNSL